MHYNSSDETFNDFLKKRKSRSKPSWTDLATSGKTFLFAKLRVQMQNELAMAGKHDASMEENRTSVQRRCQFAQLLPTTSSAQPFNQMSTPEPPTAVPQSSNSQPQQNRETKRKFDGQ